MATESYVKAKKEDFTEMKAHFTMINANLKVVLQQMTEINQQLKELNQGVSLVAKDSNVISRQIGEESKLQLQEEDPEGSQGVAERLPQQNPVPQKLKSPTSKAEGDDSSLLIATIGVAVEEIDMVRDNLFFLEDNGKSHKVVQGGADDSVAGTDGASLEKVAVFLGKRSNILIGTKLGEDKIWFRVCLWGSAKNCIKWYLGCQWVVFDPGISCLFKNLWLVENISDLLVVIHTWGFGKGDVGLKQNSNMLDIMAHYMFELERKSATDGTILVILGAAFANSDMYGGAIVDAGEQIKPRMEPIVSKPKFNSYVEHQVLVKKLKEWVDGATILLSQHVKREWEVLSLGEAKHYEGDGIHKADGISSKYGDRMRQVDLKLELQLGQQGVIASNTEIHAKKIMNDDKGREAEHAKRCKENLAYDCAIIWILTSWPKKAGFALELKRELRSQLLKNQYGCKLFVSIGQHVTWYPP